MKRRGGGVLSIVFIEAAVPPARRLCACGRPNGVVKYLKKSNLRIYMVVGLSGQRGGRPRGRDERMRMLFGQCLFVWVRFPI